ncbi:MAG: DinB family protein [Chloroflexi bacterium]|nr:DinB family protein [Chloroflexota bacterium]
MSGGSVPRIDIAERWGRMNDTLVALVDYVPDDKLNWSPREGLWNFRGILLHTIMTRHNWLHGFVRDGEGETDVLGKVRSKEDIRRALRESWERVHRFLSDDDKLAGFYQWDDPKPGDDGATGHWVAFHLLDHDIHHRADIFHYLSELGIEHPDVGTP